MNHRVQKQPTEPDVPELDTARDPAQPGADSEALRRREQRSIDADVDDDLGLDEPLREAAGRRVASLLAGHGASSRGSR